MTESERTVLQPGIESAGARWVVLFCDARAKLCPISDFIEECRAAHQIKLLHILELLEQLGPGLPRPYADTLRDGVHELRVKLSGEQIRMLYFFCYERYIVFYAVLRKHTDRVPARYIEATRHYREEFLQRVDRSQLEAMKHGHPREHLAVKLSDVEFRESYGNWCEACARTMEVIGRIHERGATVEELAQQVGIEPARVAAFIDAERCEYEVISSLCAHFGLTPPADCPRKNPR